MSHTQKISKVPIKDISALRSAVRDLVESGIQCSLVQNKKPRMYYSDQHGVCDHVLVFENGDYDIGFDKQNDGSYVPVFDDFGGRISRFTGAACPMPNTHEGQLQHAVGKLMQSYSKHAAINAATNAGYSVESCYLDDDGHVQIQLAV